MVETFTRREVQPSGQTPGFQQVRYSPDSFGAQIGRALQGAGQSLASLSTVMKQGEDEKRANDALHKVNAAKDELRPWLYDPQDGIFAKSGGNAMGTGGQANEVLEDIKRRYLDEIDDPETQQAFERLWMREAESTKDSVARHELTELGTYKVETTKATLTTAMQDAYDKFNDPDAIDRAMETAFKAIAVNSAGLPKEALSAAEDEARSQIHLAVVSRWAIEDPYKALEYYEQHKEFITGKDHIVAGQLVDAARQNRKADENVIRITGAGAAAYNIYGAIESAESAGDPDAVSSAGAIGLMQLMPDTARYVLNKTGRSDIAALPEEELKARLKEDKGLNRELGRYYFNEQLKTFGGDVEAALVAYNAGPKWAEKFLQHNAGKAPGQRDYDVPGNSKLKSETEPYVGKVLGKLGVNPSLPPKGYRMTRENWGLKNFSPADLMSPSEGGQWVDARSAMALDELAGVMQRRFGVKVSVNEPHDFDASKGTAGRRRGTSDPKDNPHVKKSQHLQGTAFDVQWQSWTDEHKAAFIAEARKLGFRGFGFYGAGGHLHIDMGNERTWGSVPEFAREAMQTALGEAPEGGPPISIGDLPSSAASSFYGPGAGNYPNAFAGSDAPDINKWLEEAQSIADPTERERTIAKLRLVSAEQEQRLAREAAGLKQAAWDTVIQQGTAALPPELISRLEPSFVSSLYTYENHVKKDGNVPQDWQAWTDVSMLPPEELLKVDPYTEYRNRLDNEHFDRLLTMVRAAQEAQRGDASSSALLANVRTRAQIVEDIIGEQGWNTKATAGREQVASLNRAMDERILMEQKAKGRELDATEIQDIADKLLIEDKARTGYTFGLIGGQGKARDVERPDDFIAASAWEEVQQDDQMQVIDAYNELWWADPDQEQALDVYNRAMKVWLGGKPDGPEDEKLVLRQSISQGLGRPITDVEFERYYVKYLLKFLGR